MNILFFGYWGANDGLSQSTINPHLEILSNSNKVSRIVYVSIERTPSDEYLIPLNPKVIHKPFTPLKAHRFITKLTDLLRLPFFLREIVIEEKIDLLMCRSSLAGGIGYLTHKLTGIPFTVESFEPHADYMCSIGVWSGKGISYRIQKFLEEKQKQHAAHLMPVSYQHREHLMQEGLNGNMISVMPCGVKPDVFRFNNDARIQVRKKLHLDESTTVGIYVGKFGDLYMDKEAFALFKKAFDFFEDFYLILLNSQPSDFVGTRLEEFGIPNSQVLHTVVDHAEVPGYLSASDFAFSLHRPSAFSFAFSPIKNGEYWANGLPVVMPKGIGDDSELTVKYEVGVVADIKEDNLEVDMEKLHLLIGLDRETSAMVMVANEFRNFDQLPKLYDKIMDLEVGS